MPPLGGTTGLPASKSYTWLAVTIMALLVGGPLLLWGGLMMRRLRPSYLEDASDVPAVIERSVGCKPCSVSNLVVKKTGLIVSMADPASDANQLWDIQGGAGSPRDGWDLGRGDAAAAFNPRDVDWSRMKSEAADWQKRSRRKEPPFIATVRRCADERERICFDFR